MHLMEFVKDNFKISKIKAKANCKDPFDWIWVTEDGEELLLAEYATGLISQTICSMSFIPKN